MIQIYIYFIIHTIKHNLKYHLIRAGQHGSNVCIEILRRLVDYTSKEGKVIPIANDEQERGSNMKNNPSSFGGILVQK